MKKLTVWMALTVLLTLSIVAAEPAALTPARLKLAQEFITINQNYNRLENYAAARLGRYKALVDKQLERVNDRQEADKVRKELYAVIDKELDWSAVRDNVIKIYAAQFSDDELKEMIKFFKSTVGQKMLSRNDEINRELTTLFRGHITTADQKIREILGKVLAAHVGQPTLTNVRPLGVIPAKPDAATPAAPAKK